MTRDRRVERIVVFAALSLAAAFVVVAMPAPSRTNFRRISSLSLRNTGGRRTAVETAIARITISLAGAVTTWFIYTLALDFIPRWFGPNALHFANARTVLGTAAIAIFAVWAVLPNLFRKFDASSVTATLVAGVLLVPVWFLSLIVSSCGVFGDCL